MIKRRQLVCYNSNHESYLHESVERIKKGVTGCEIVGLDSDEPAATFDALHAMIEGVAKDGISHVALDMTGFTREALAMLLFLAKERLPAGSRITAFYHKAKSYGQDEHKGWLTQGVREVRSIVGYPGKMRISGNTDLILISGFETERAQEIIDTIQPNQILLGRLVADAGGADAHDDTLNALTAKLEALYAGTRVSRFNFSKNDPFVTRDSILKAVSSSSNTVLASLNSKPTMVGACLAAMENKSVQLVYSQPHCYNVADYSEPSGKIIFFELAF